MGIPNLTSWEGKARSRRMPCFGFSWAASAQSPKSELSHATSPILNLPSKSYLKHANDQPAPPIEGWHVVHRQDNLVLFNFIFWLRVAVISNIRITLEEFSSLTKIIHSAWSSSCDRYRDAILVAIFISIKLYTGGEKTQRNDRSDSEYCRSMF